jgi:ferredoxin
VTWGIPLNAWRQTGKDDWQPRQDAGGTPGLNVIGDHCVGCSACVEVCQPGALQLMSGVWAVAADPDLCNGCRRCVPACPFGLVTVSGMTRTRHQLVLDNLATALASSCPPGWRVYTGDPSAVSTLAATRVVPDLAVSCEEPQAGTWPGHTPGTVVLVVEIISPSTRSADLGHKREVYRAHGVPAYWTLDQRDGQVTVHWSGHPTWFDRWAGNTFG